MLKPIVIDGSNVALSHGNNVVFSCKGIRICVDWFRSRGHKEIKAFVPSWRKETTRSKSPIKDQEILFELEREDFLVFTPSRWICGKRIICYDDRYILKFAADIDGIVVSNDNYRDLITECQEFKKVVVERVLMYSFINDRFMPPDDPMGRNGPSLDEFLRRHDRCEESLPICPYGKKCTYGHKCKYRHINNESNLSVINHNALRKTVSAPPYLDNQQSSKAKTKSQTSEPHYYAWMPEFHNSTCEQKETLISVNGQKISSCQLLVASEDRNGHGDEDLSCHKKLTSAASAPVVLPKHKKLTRLSSTPSKPNTVPDNLCPKDVNLTEKRRQLFFHLSNVFPKEHVESVFRIFPNETNPNLICDALIKLNISNS